MVTFHKTQVMNLNLIFLLDWMNQWSHDEDDLETVRGTLGRIFSQNDIDKPISVLSGRAETHAVW